MRNTKLTDQERIAVTKAKTRIDRFPGARSFCICFTLAALFCSRYLRYNGTITKEGR